MYIYIIYLSCITGKLYGLNVFYVFLKVCKYVNMLYVLFVYVYVCVYLC